MRISEKKQTELFGAVADPIMDLRLDAIHNEMSQDEVDDLLFHLQFEIYKRIKNVLDIKESS